jgi:hypothetical protein
MGQGARYQLVRARRDFAGTAQLNDAVPGVVDLILKLVEQVAPDVSTRAGAAEAGKLG